MFTNIRLKNYKSLVDFNISLLQKKGVAKKAAIIYGENGVGKSNFASVFYTLCESMRTLSVRKAIQTFLEKRGDDVSPDESFIRALSNSLRDTESIVKNCKTIGSEDNMYLEFDFILGERVGNYLLEYDDTKIVHEKLEFVLNKNKCVLYDLTEKEKKFNNKIFIDNEYADEIKELVYKYDGKHSLLSIVVNEKEEKAEGYVEKRIHSALYEVIAFFMTLSIKVKKEKNGERGTMGLSHQILGELTDGTVDLEDEIELNKAESMLNEFFTKTYSDIKEVYYKRNIEEGKIGYELFFKKKVYNRIIDVSYELESTGTQHLLSILPYLLMSVEGTVVVIDELDAGIHDLLVGKLLSNIIDYIQGQLIITTHNTMFLETDINPEYIYSFVVDKDANKELVSIIEFEDRAHPNLNYRNRYLKGMYGGVPHLGDIDFDELSDILC